MLAFPTAISFDFNLHELSGGGKKFAFSHFPNQRVNLICIFFWFHGLSGGGKKLAFPNSQIHRVNLVCYFFWFHEMSGVEKMLAFPYFKFIEWTISAISFGFRENFSSLWPAHRGCDCSCCWRRCWRCQPCSGGSSQGLRWRPLAKNDCLCRNFLSFLSPFLARLRINLWWFIDNCFRKEVGYCCASLIWLRSTTMRLQLWRHGTMESLMNRQPRLKCQRSCVYFAIMLVGSVTAIRW